MRSLSRCHRLSLCLTLALGLALNSAAQTVAQPADVLRAGDELSVDVREHSELTASVRVDRNGSIRLPLCGRVQAVGETEDSLAEALQKKYEGCGIENPFVYVRITSYAPRNVYVLGEVTNGGVILEIRPPEILTVMKAVTAAGGFTETADLSSVHIRRPRTGAPAEKILVDVLGLIHSGGEAEDIPLHVDDTVYVPRSKPVFVVGEVGSAGPYYIGTRPGIRCTELLAEAGWISDKANREEILIFRDGRQKDDAVETVDVATILRGKLEQDVFVRPGDMVVVNRQKQVFVLGEVGSPGPIDIEPNAELTALQAIILCGGFSEYASEKKILLVRDNKATVLDLRKPFTEEGKVRHDPRILPGDVLYVQESLW